MQTHYFDIKAIPQAEMLQSAVVSHLLQVLHRYLPEYNTDNDDPIALAFPAYGQAGTLGGIIRVFGNEEKTTALHQQLGKISDYALITACEKIPEKVKGYAYFYRQRFKGNSHLRHLKQRAEDRGEAWSPEHEKAVTKKYSNHKHVPFAVLKSSSTGQDKIWLHIGMQKADAPSQGSLSAYGVNVKSQVDKMTVPIF